MSRAELHGLKKFLSTPGVSHFERFINEQVKVLTKNMTERRPVGTHEDYWQWGYDQGSLRVHEAYSNLVELIDQEFKRREESGESIVNDLTAEK